MLTIKQITTKKELKLFIRFATTLYKDCKTYCPALEDGEISIFTDNPTLNFSDFANFLAYRDGKIVGRITALINHDANKHWGVKKLRFGWFDFIDDYEVSSTLLNTAVKWGKEKGMDCLNGPVGFTDIDHQGLLIEGYEYDTPMISLFNYPYYVDHYEKYGLKKDVDWVEYRVYVPEKVPEKMDRVARIVLEKYKLKIVKVKSAKEMFERFGLEYFEVFNKAYEALYNFQALTEEQMKYYTDAFLPMLNFDFVTVVLNEAGEMVGFAFGMPNITEALRKCQGKMLPLGWYHLLKALKSKRFDVFDLVSISVRPDYQNKGVNSLFFYDQIPYFNKYGVKYAETTAILEDNTKNRANWEYFDFLIHKKRRAYIKAI